MTKTTYEYDRRRRAAVPLEKLPKGMRGIDPEWDVHTFKEGPLRRLLNRRH